MKTQFTAEARKYGGEGRHCMGVTGSLVLQAVSTVFLLSYRRILSFIHYRESTQNPLQGSEWPRSFFCYPGC